MLSKRSFIIILLLALAGGGYYFMRDPAPENPAKEEQKAEAGPGQEEKAEKPGHDEGGKEEAGHEEAPADSAEIPKNIADSAGIKTETVGSANIAELITLTGRITLNQNTTAQVKARFPGIVREVKKGQGEAVNAGDVLAMVESNDSLQIYPVKAPISGVILVRNTNIGDVAGDSPMFTIANVSDVWAEFHVFPRDIDRIKNGQIVHVTSFEGQHTGQAPITVLSPLAESSSQTVVARVTLDNTESSWRSGMTVRGDVAVNEKQVPLAVKTSAIQRMEGKSVVFAQEGDRYVMRPIKTGLSDEEWTEVKEGLQAGNTYVSENSFMIKADIGKAGAEHED
jgi:cobalt-zinc-cadmium efflux system membrane fusion protein